MADNKNDYWKLQDVWNEALPPERIQKPRDYIRASEIGRPFLDRWYAMKGVQPSNPFDSRVLRIFDVGNIFEKFLIELMFRSMGLVKSTQSEVKVEIDGFLPVIGHHDPKMGGKIDVAQSEEMIEKMFTLFPEDPPEWWANRMRAVRDMLLEKHPRGLNEVITEIKTINSRSFWSHRNVDPVTGFFAGYHHHKLQLYTYLLGTGMNEGKLIYLSKDDMVLADFNIFVPNKALDNDWREDIGTMTEYYKSGKQPPRQPDIVFNDEKGVYEFNWQVGRSNYLTKITGFETKDAWEKSLLAELKRKNRAKCKKCNKEFTLGTLNKNKGYCGRCAKAMKGKS